MSPIVAASLVPRGEAGRDDGTIETDRVLLQTRKQRVCSHQSRHSLYERCSGIAGHQCCKAHEELARHHAVSIQDDEELIGTPEPLHPVGNVAGLLADVLRSSTVEDVDMPRQATSQQMKKGEVFTGKSKKR